MLKVNSILILLLLALSSVQGQQTSSDLQKQLDELKTRIRILEKDNREISSAGRAGDSIAYCRIRTEIFDAFSGISQLDVDYKNITEKIEVTGLFSKLLQASNPSSDILGFRFTDIIFKSAEKHFLAELKNEKDKKRFSEVISKIIDNPVVTALANTNPVTSIVASMISAIAGFTTSKVDLEKDGGKIRNISVEQESAFDHRSINAFHKELEIYIEFYDAMIITSTKFIKSIEYLRIKYFYLLQNIREYKSDLYGSMNINEKNLLVRLSAVLPDPETPGLDYNSLLLDDAIIRSQAMTAKYSSLHNSVEEFRTEYNLLLFNFLDDYRQILESVLDFPERDTETQKTLELINSINEFINSQLTEVPK